jgi:uncharacterized DUF497 family protein
MTTITYDPAKDASNRLKHGVSLALANELELDTLERKSDTRATTANHARLVMPLQEAACIAWCLSIGLKMPPPSAASSA